MFERAANFAVAAAFVAALGNASSSPALGTHAQPAQPQPAPAKVDVHVSGSVTVGTLPNGRGRIGDYSKVVVEVDATIDPRPDTRQ